MGYGHFQHRNLKKRKRIVRFSVKIYHREYPMVIFNPEILKNGCRLSVFQPRNLKKNGSRLSVFQSKHTIGSTPWSFSTQKLKKTERKQIVRFSVKTYHREYPMAIFNPEIKKNGSRLSFFQTKHTIGSTYGHFQPRNLKKRKQIVR